MILLQFSTENDPFSALIRWYTRSEFSHVDIVMPDGWLLGARLKGGVKLRPPGYAHFTRLTHYSLPLDNSHAVSFLNLARAQIGKPYDWSAILAFAVNRNWRHPGRWFCSELVAWLAESCSYPLLRVPSSDRVTPRDLIVSLRVLPAAR